MLAFANSAVQVELSNPNDMTGDGAIQIFTLTHLWACLGYWSDCLFRTICYECKALLEILVNGQADRLEGLR